MSTETSAPPRAAASAGNDASIGTSKAAAPVAAAKTVMVEAPDEAKARAAAAGQLGAPEHQLELRVVSRHKRGLFGLGGEAVTFEVTWRPQPAGAAAAAEAQKPAPAPDEPARVEFTCERGRLSIAIHRPQGRGRATDITVIDKLTEGWPLDARDEAVIQQALRSMDGRPRVFATISPSVAPPEGAAAAVRVAKDEFTAWLIPWNAVPLAAAQLFDLIGGAGIVEGLDEELVEHVAGKVLDHPVVIASGQQPKDGKDASIEFVFEALLDAKAKEKAEAVQKDRVDFREMGAAAPSSVQPGDVLARKVPAVPAEDGFTVKGKPIPAKKAKDVELKRLAGQNTQVSEDGSAIVCTTGGQASRVGEKIAVMPIHTVDGDVDFKSGNVYFEGNLQIRGGVKPGFKVTATGAVQVGGTLEGATIEAGGDVTINGGVVGQKEGVIRAGGAVSARFVQEAEIYAGGPVTVASEIRESTVISGAKVTVGGQGRIVGGLVRGRDEVEARIAGSPSATPTTIQAGWGEQLEVETGDEVRIPKIAIRNDVQPGVLLTVAGASQRFTRQQVGGVWREKDGKLLYSAS